MQTMLALFDGLVAVTAIFAAFKARRQKTADFFSQGGYAAIAIAALIGTVKFSGVQLLAPHHAIASHIAAIVGVPYAATGFLLVSRDLKLWAVISIAALFVAAAYVFWASQSYALIAGIFAQAIWLWGGWRERRTPGRVLLRVILSVVLTTVAGLVFAGGGKFHGVDKENIFHALLALALVQQAYAYSYTGLAQTELKS